MKPKRDDWILLRRYNHRTLHLVRMNGRGKTLCRQLQANMVTTLASEKSNMCAACVDAHEKLLRRRNAK